jgi:hypothetical protein
LASVAFLGECRAPRGTLTEELGTVAKNPATISHKFLRPLLHPIIEL